MNKKEKYVITRGQYGSNSGKFVCVLENLAVFKKLMMNCHYTFDSVRMRFHNDNTRNWYGVCPVEILEQKEIIEFFNVKFEDISEAKHYKKARLTSSDSIPRIRRKTPIKSYATYV